MLPERLEGGVAVDALHGGVLAEEEAGALEKQGAEQRNEHEDHEHLDEGQAEGRSRGGSGDGAAAIHSSGSRTFSYPTERIRQVPSGRPRSLMANSIS